MEPTGSHSMPDCLRAEAEGQQLLPGDHAVLARNQLPYRSCPP
jgi:hypothetical protein